MTVHNAMVDLERLDAAQAWVGDQAAHSEQVEAPALILAILYEWKR